MIIIKKTAIRFALIGILTVIVDFISYKTLLNFFPTYADPSKAIAFFLGVVFSYPLNKSFTFNDLSRRNKMPQYLLVYVGSLAINTFINNIMKSHLSTTFANMSPTNLAFGVATSCSAIFNYLLLSNQVFNLRKA